MTAGGTTLPAAGRITSWRMAALATSKLRRRLIRSTSGASAMPTARFTGFNNFGGGGFRFALVFSGGGAIFSGSVSPNFSWAVAPADFRRDGGGDFFSRGAGVGGRAGGLSGGRLGHGKRFAQQ